MKGIFFIFAGILLVSPAMAEGALQLELTPTTNIVTTSYVRGAYNVLDGAKQEKLTSSGNSANVVVDSNTSSKPLVSAISASDGTVTITKSDVTLPVGSASSPTGRANIWVE